jgi:hypothetical protein
MYHFQENNKTKLEPNRWKCEICGKLFISEKHLDNHFENRHNNSLQTVNSIHIISNLYQR